MLQKWKNHQKKVNKLQLLQGTILLATFGNITVHSEFDNFAKKVVVQIMEAPNDLYNDI